MQEKMASINLLEPFIKSKRSKMISTPSKDGSMSGTPKTNLYMPSPEFRKIQAKYQDLVNKMEENSNVGESDADAPSFLSRETCAGVENQQWELMWSHVMSIIAEVIPTESTAQTWTDRRHELVDRVSKLVRIAKSAQELKHAKEESEKLKSELKTTKIKMEEQQQKLKQYEEMQFHSKIDNIKQRMQVHIDEQNKLLAESKVISKKRKELAQRTSLESIKKHTKEEMKKVEIERKSHSQRKKCRKIVITEYVSDASDDSSVADPVSHVCKQKQEYKPEPVAHVCKQKQEYKTEVNRLIAATNQMRRDYRKLGELLKEEGISLSTCSEISALSD